MIALTDPKPIGTGASILPLGPTTSVDPDTGGITIDGPAPVVPDAPPVPDDGGTVSTGLRSIAPRGGIGGTGNVDPGGGGEASYSPYFRKATLDGGGDPSVNDAPPVTTDPLTTPINWSEFLPPPLSFSGGAPASAPTTVGSTSGSESNALANVLGGIAGAIGADPAAKKDNAVAGSKSATVMPTVATPSKAPLVVGALAVGGGGWLLYHGYTRGWFKALGIGG